MKLSVVFVTIAAAFTGSANAAEITNGNLRATSLEKAEVFEDPSDPVSSYEQCVLDNCTLKKPKDKDAQKMTEDELKNFFGQCVSDCRGPDDASRAAVDKAFSPVCSEACAEEAAGEVKEVGKSCNSKNDIKCKKCNEEDDDYKKCEKEYNECEKCQDEVDDAQKSVKKASEKLMKCLPGCNPEYQTYIEYLQITNGNLRATSLAKAEVFEEPTDPVSSYKQCVLDNCALKKPKDTDAQKLTEEELKIFFEQCVSDCRGPDDASRAAVDEAYNPVCSVECADAAAGELKEVSKDCDSKKDIQCVKCNNLAGDELEKCEDELDDCEECEKEVSDAQKSVEKASDKLEECLPKCLISEYQTYIELA